jgi:hypothetical protein
VIDSNGLLTFTSGVRIDAPNTTVQGNKIGFPIDLQSVDPGLGNGLHGVEVHVSNVLIGGSGAGQGNTIFFNGGNGVAVDGNVTGVRISENNLGGSGTGPIGLTNGANAPVQAPVLISVSGTPTGAAITGKLQGQPNTLYRIELYGSPVAGPLGSGAGLTFLGFVTVTTDAQGTALFGFNPIIPGGVPAGVTFAATATNLAGSTSEMSQAAEAGFVLAADPPAAVPAALAAAPSRGLVASLVTLSVGKKKVLFVVERFADTGEVRALFPSPFQPPKFKAITVTLSDVNGDGIADLLVVSALRKGKTEAAIFLA